MNFEQCLPAQDESELKRVSMRLRDRSISQECRRSTGLSRSTAGLWIRVLNKLDHIIIYEGSLVFRSTTSLHMDDQLPIDKNIHNEYVPWQVRSQPRQGHVSKVFLVPARILGRPERWVPTSMSTKVREMMEYYVLTGMRSPGT